MPRPRLRIEEQDEITLVSFLDRRIADERTVQALADQLFGLLEDDRLRLLLDFTGVEYFSSTALGKLISFHKKLSSLQGVVSMCNMSPQVLAVFTITKLDKDFNIYDDEAAAKAALGEPSLSDAS